MWYNYRLYPEINLDSYFPNITLLIDNHIIKCFCPKGRFGDAKTYWDTKNHIYSLKSEVTIDTKAPHYCRFVQGHTSGSIHDYQ
jgi:hypothetical protein